MLTRLLQECASSGPAARSAPVATILLGDAAVVIADIFIWGGIRAPLTLIAQVRSSQSQHPLLLSLFLLIRHHYHL
jgi:hypothetical protein